MGNSHSAKAAFWASDDKKIDSKLIDLESSECECPDTFEDKDEVTSATPTTPSVSPSVEALQMPTELQSTTSSLGGLEPSVEENPIKPKALNLGTFDELHKPTKDLMLLPYEGIRFCANRGLSSHFQVQHTVHLNTDKSSYRFGSTYVGNKQPCPTEAYPVLVGEMNNDGDLQAQLIHLFGKSFKVKCIAQTAGSKVKSFQAGLDIAFSSSCLSLIAADPDIFNRSGMLIVQYLQGLTPSVSIGADLIHQRCAMRQNTMMTIAGRYRTPLMQFAANLGSAGAHLSFYRKANENVQVGVELEARTNLESLTTLAYQMDVPKMNLLFKGMVNSEWTIGSSFEKRLLPFPVSLNMTATYNIKQDKATLGLGCMLG